jgi:hypothetical protein
MYIVRDLSGDSVFVVDSLNDLQNLIKALKDDNVDKLSKYDDITKAMDDLESLRNEYLSDLKLLRRKYGPKIEEAVRRVNSLVD